jgi:hypothetical protein
MPSGGERGDAALSYRGLTKRPNGSDFFLVRTAFFQRLSFFNDFAFFYCFLMCFIAGLVLAVGF